MNNHNCCYKCQDRHQLCHNTCNKYKAYKDRLALIKANKEEMKKQYSKFRPKKMF